MSVQDPPILPTFFVMLAALVLLILITFSMPLVPGLYFLYASQGGGVRFGMWGWCLDQDGACQHPLKLGYTWEPEVSSPVTKAHVFFPIATVSTLCALVSLIPVLMKRTSKTERVFSYLCLFSFLMAAIPTLFALSIWSVAKDRFLAAGFEAQFGALPWMALAATFLLMIISLHSGCGTLSRSRRGPYPPWPSRY